eukprot:gnl/MRDRNA2_/MRDRNA2_107628_c0_seq1.p1 gnl/MRDRNA2_/MRDRNA2_107628_c0~~gnl/MRDRNA2_/MRDRNA2_107628_c0_seq1.p1  ORF type:complete len:441 (+),score=74.15 gnl/MRDRNA2_/MRDRNA2_107628_c0_seq1:96-1418(+)
MVACPDSNLGSLVSRTDSFSWAAGTEAAKKDIDQYRSVRRCDILQSEGGALGIDPRAIHIDSKGGVRRCNGMGLQSDGCSSSFNGGAMHVHDVRQTEGGAAIVSFGCGTARAATSLRRPESMPPPRCRETLSPRFTQLEHTIRADKLANILRQPTICSNNDEEWAQLHLRRLGWNNYHHLSKSALEEDPMNLTSVSGFPSSPRKALLNGTESNILTSSSCNSLKPCVESVARPFRALYHPTRYSFHFGPDAARTAHPVVERQPKPSVKDIQRRAKSMDVMDLNLVSCSMGADHSKESSPLISPRSSLSPLSMDSTECFKKADPDEEDDIASASTRANSRRSSGAGSTGEAKSPASSETQTPRPSGLSAKAHPTKKHNGAVKVHAQPKDMHQRRSSCANDMLARMKQTYSAEGSLGRVDRLEATLARMKKVAQELYAEYDA